MAHRFCCGRGACFLPLAGICGFLAHPKLYKMVFIPYCALGIGSLIGASCLVLTYQWQYALVDAGSSYIQDIPDWDITTTTVFVLLAELFCIMFLLYIVFFYMVQQYIIQVVLDENRVQERPHAHPPDQLSCFAKCWRWGTHLLIMVSTLAVYKAPFPLGPIIWYLFNGWMYTWELVYEPVAKLGLLPDSGCCRGLRYALRHCCLYASFGAVALLLASVPFIGPIFLFTNAYGAGLLVEGLAYSADDSDSDGDNTASASEAGRA
eukprot:TRINITY_DN9903_c0_g1_i1.p1 TRINITY_DN9903_c0_g1~~TRINITY_DN9903_c0_g1_i1.p1  ORF type:complete len:264 (-),score=34.81 TRINITY_DN9903_c0_g1_i1:363-1154(-)